MQWGSALGTLVQPLPISRNINGFVDKTFSILVYRMKREQAFISSSGGLSRPHAFIDREAPGRCAKRCGQS